MVAKRLSQLIRFNGSIQLNEWGLHMSTFQNENLSNMIHRVGLGMPWTTEGLGLF